MTTAPSLPYHHDPLSHSRAAFNGHAGRSSPIASSSRPQHDASVHINGDSHDITEASEQTARANGWMSGEVDGEGEHEWRDSMEAIRIGKYFSVP
jgi:hypothetical protein